MRFKVWDKVKVVKIVWDHFFDHFIWSCYTIWWIIGNQYKLKWDQYNMNWYEEELELLESPIVYSKWEVVEVSNYRNPNKTQWIRRIYIGKVDWPYNGIIVVSKDYEEYYNKWEPYAIQTYSQIRKVKEVKIPNINLSDENKEVYKKLFNIK